MTQDEIRTAVRETLLALGFDVNDPLEVQKDMATLRDIRLRVADSEFKKDMAALREWRETMDSAKARGVAAILGMVFLGGATAFLYALKTKLGW